MRSPGELNSEKLSSFLWELLRYSPGATILVDREETIVATNANAAKLLRSEREELEGRAIETLIPAHVQEAWSQFFTRCFSNTEDWPFEEARDLWVCLLYTSDAADDRPRV